uniref:Uncharacterized protein n=1 Tax=Romanomermis culicivorax TaxID=13658 RepID=A0A915L988_ROMCU
MVVRIGDMMNTKPKKTKLKMKYDLAWRVFKIAGAPVWEPGTFFCRNRSGRTNSLYRTPLDRPPNV